jgi:hypothetical protein
MIPLACLALLLLSTTATADRWNRFDGTVPPGLTERGIEPDEMIRSGLLSIAHYGADPTGEADATAAIQQALFEARDYGYVVYVPSGTYRLTDTLSINMVAHFRERAQKWAPIVNTANAIIGQTDGPRPVFRLDDNASAFSEPANPKPMVDIWQHNTPEVDLALRERHFGQSWGFHQTFRNINLDLGHGNRGAVGISINGAQGSSLEDVEIQARDGYAGVWSIPGRSMGAVNVTVRGGQYGIYLHRNNQSILVGCKLIGQSKLALRVSYNMTPQTLVGFHIEKESGPILQLSRGGNQAGENFAFYDGTIVITGDSDRPIIDNRAGKSLYLRNVYVRGAKTVVDSPDPLTVDDADGWQRLEEYAYADRGGDHPAFMLIDGEQSQRTISRVSPAGAPPDDLISQHTWEKLPSFKDDDTVSVKDSSFGAKGDGKTDDTAAIQKAIDTHEKVFLPAGMYAISQPLRLRKDTKLFGLALKNTAIVQADSWKPTQEVAMITTPSSKESTAYLADFMFRSQIVELEHDYVTMLDWKLGGDAMVRMIRWHYMDWLPKAPGNWDANPISHVRFSGDAGGRWYMIDALRGHSQRVRHPDIRLVTFENTKQPITFYGLNLEHNEGDTHLEAIDSANIRIFAVKVENREKPIMTFRNCENVFFSSNGGHARMGEGEAAYNVIDSKNVVLSMIFGGADGKRGYNPEGYVVRHQDSDHQHRISQQYNCALFKTGTFDDSVFHRP